MKKNKKKDFSQRNMTQKEILENELINNKEVEFYSHLVNGWIITRMEKDKAILTLSTAGLGVLVAFFNNISYNNNLGLLLYGLALLCFIVSIISGVWILSANADYCEAVIKEEEPKNENLIDCLDKFLMWSFIIGLFISISLSFVLISEKDLKEVGKTTVSKSVKTLGKEVLSLQKKYENNTIQLKSDLTKLKNLEVKATAAENVKKQLKKEIEVLSLRLKDLEDTNSLKEEKEQLENKIKQITKVN